MIPRKYLIFVWLTPMVVANWIGMTFVDPTGPSLLLLAFFFGSLFAHASLAAAWFILGPLRFAYRAPLSLIWLLLLVVVISIHTARGMSHAEAPYNVCLVANWTVALTVLMVARLLYGFSLRHGDDYGSQEASRFQFGISQLLMATCLVAVVLGVGRAVVTPLTEYFGADVLIFFLVIGTSGASVALPIILSALSQQSARRLMLQAMPCFARSRW